MRCGSRSHDQRLRFPPARRRGNVARGRRTLARTIVARWELPWRTHGADRRTGVSLVLVASDEYTSEHEGLAVSVGGRVLLDDMSIDVDRGQCWAIIGRNGAGKTSSFAHSPDSTPSRARSAMRARACKADARERALARSLLPQDSHDAFPASVLETHWSVVTHNVRGRLGKRCRRRAGARCAHVRHLQLDIGRPDTVRRRAQARAHRGMLVQDARWRGRALVAPRRAQQSSALRFSCSSCGRAAMQW